MGDRVDDFATDCKHELVNCTYMRCANRDEGFGWWGGLRFRVVLVDEDALVVNA